MRAQAMRALVVDDATTVRMFHRGILEAAGFTVEEAMNGLEGLERALGGPTPPDLLLVDVNMPRMDGYAFLRAVRAEPGLRDIPAIMISTEREERDADRAFEAGANLFLAKPGKPDALARLARSLAGADPEADLGACEHLHTALAQLLLAARVRLAARPYDRVLATCLGAAVALPPVLMAPLAAEEPLAPPSDRAARRPRGSGRRRNRGGSPDRGAQAAP
jgi:two-component system chemotaxis response regulator CheY